MGRSYANNTIYGDTDQRNYVYAPGSDKAGYGSSPNIMGGADMHYVGAPRTFAGRSGGYADLTFAGGNQPMNAPQMSSEQMLRRQNMGTLPRGPSSQFASSEQGMQRFPSYNLNGQAQAATPMQSGQQHVAAFNKTRHDLLQRERDDAAKAMAASLKSLPLDENNKPIFDDRHRSLVIEHERRQTALRNYRDQYTGTQSATPAQTAPTTQPTQQTPAPYTDPYTGKPSMNAPITDANRIDVNAPGYQANRRENLYTAYQTAGADLAANPALGTTPMQAPQQAPLSVPPGGMGNSPADYRQASGQAYRNQAAIQRQMDSSRIAGLDKNAAAFKQNGDAAVAINDRMQQMQGGDYSLSQPAGPNAGGTNYAPSAAHSGAVQPSQQQAAKKPTRAVAQQFVQRFGDPQRAMEELKKQGFDVSGYAD